MADWRPYHATNEPGTCLWCGHKLRQKKGHEKPGDYGDGHFCGLRCAYQFGVAMADPGRRLRAMDSPPEVVRIKRPPPPKCPVCGKKMYEYTINGKDTAACTNSECEDENEVYDVDDQRRLLAKCAVCDDEFVYDTHRECEECGDGPICLDCWTPAENHARDGCPGCMQAIDKDAV
jgi:hypothetical protein